MIKIPISENLTTEFKSAYNKDVIETLVAFANASGGTVFIGVSDNARPLGINVDKATVQNWVDEIKSETEPTIIPAVEIFQSGGKDVVAFSVSEFPVKPVATRGRHFKRINNLNHLLNSSEIADEHLESINSSWDFYIDPNHTTLDLSREKMTAFATKIRRNKHIGLIQLSDADLLNKMEFLRYGKVSFGAYLMFAKGYCLISDVRMGRFKSDGTVSDHVLLSTDLFQEFDDIISYIKKHIAFTYPPAVIHEIVLNMIIHRDYRDSSPSVIKIFDNKIEFYNPGRLYGGANLEELFTEKYTSKSRNKLIAKAFREVAMTQYNDTGISRICRICRDNSIRQPLFRETANGFQVIIYNEKHYEPTNTINSYIDTIKTAEKAENRTTNEQNSAKNTIRDTSNSTANDVFKLSDNQKAILDEIKKNPEITSETLAQIIGITVRNIKVNIAKLKDRGLIERVGAKKNGCWRVKKGIL
jgi:ATP-dependent DNA helicase RecG